MSRKLEIKIRKNNVPLTSCVCNVRLITSVEVSFGDKFKRFDRWLRLEFFNVDIVLYV